MSLQRSLSPGQPIIPDYYTDLSQVTEYIVYGRVTAELDPTKGAITPDKTSLKIPITYQNFAIDVLQSVDGQGRKNKQAPLANTIIIRQASTTHSPRFALGESLLVFLESDSATGTYRVVGLRSTPSRDLVQGKFTLTLRDGQPYTPSGEIVSQVLQSVAAPSQSN